MSPEFLAAGVQIIVVNLLLSGDNAVVIALACRNLPETQRKVAVFWGVFGAVAARIVLTLFAVKLLALPWLKIVGGALLLWIGVQLIAQDDGDHEVHGSGELLAAVRTVVMADIVMSLDNVVAVAAAARGSLSLLVFGLALSIPIVVLGSSLVMKLIERFPLLVIAGGGLLGWIAGGMATHDAAAASFFAAQPQLVQWLPAAGFALVVVAGVAVARLQKRGQDLTP